jgi:hypothetical protein
MATPKKMTDGRALLELKMLYREARRAAESVDLCRRAFDAAKAREASGYEQSNHSRALQEASRQLREVGEAYVKLRRHSAVKKALVDSNEEVKEQTAALERVAADLPTGR